MCRVFSYFHGERKCLEIARRYGWKLGLIVGSSWFVTILQLDLEVWTREMLLDRIEARALDPLILVKSV